MDISEQNFPQSHFRGICFVLLAFFCSACISALGKTLLHQVPLGMLLFTQNIVAFSLYCLFYSHCLKQSFQTKKIRWHLFRALNGLASYLCLFLAIKYIPLVNATLLANSTPLFLPLILLLWFRQKITLGLWICLLIGFGGVCFIVTPTRGISSLINSWMNLVALAGSVFSALALQSIRYLERTEKIHTVNLYYFGLSSLITLPWACVEWQCIQPKSGLFILAIGLVLMLTQLFLAIAYRYASPTVLAPCNYSIVVFAGILGWMFWGETATLIGGIGLLLISLGGVLSMTRLAKGSV